MSITYWEDEMDLVLKNIKNLSKKEFEEANRISDICFFNTYMKSTNTDSNSLLKKEKFHTLTIKSGMLAYTILKASVYDDFMRTVLYGIVRKTINN
jgi:hypothetical protein